MDPEGIYVLYFMVSSLLIDPQSSPPKRIKNTYIHVYMYMCLCMYVCMYVYTYVCMYVCIYIYMQLYIYIHISIQRYLSLQAV